jgi:hypothetical protein
MRTIAECRLHVLGLIQGEKWKKGKKAGRGKKKKRS